MPLSILIISYSNVQYYPLALTVVASCVELYYTLVQMSTCQHRSNLRFCTVIELAQRMLLVSPAMHTLVTVERERESTHTVRSSSGLVGP